MILVLRQDDRFLEVFESPEAVQCHFEAIDIENEEFEFCDDHGQRYVSVITEPGGWWRSGRFELRPESAPSRRHVIEFIDRASGIESDRFPDLESLRRHLDA